MHVKSIVSNAKGGISVELGEKTLIVGPNGSGKSAITNAVELALTGTASDIYGRGIMKLPADLIANLAPTHAGELFAIASLSDGRSVSWRAGVKGAGKKPLHEYPPDVLDKDALESAFPIRGVLAAIRGSEDTARKFFLQFAGNFTSDDILNRVPADLTRNYLDVIQNVDVKAPPVDRLLKALELSGKKATGSRKKSAAQKEAVTAVTDGVSPLPPEETQKAIRAEVTEAKKALEDLIRAEKSAEILSGQHQQAQALSLGLERVRASIKECEAALAQADAHIAQLQAPEALDAHTANVLAVVTHLANIEYKRWAEYQAALTTAASSGSGALAPPAPLKCPVCVQPSPAFGHFHNRKVAGDAHVQEMAQRHEPYNKALAQRSEISNTLAHWQAQETQTQIQLHALQTALAAGSPNPPTPEVMQAARDRVSKAEGELIRIEQIKVAHEQARKVRDVASDSDKESAAWARLNEALSVVVQELLDTAVASFEAKVQPYLPDTHRFKLVLREGDKQAFSFGFLRENGVDTALSGAEWVMLVSALTSACAGTRPDGRLKVIIPEDKGFDPVNLYAFLKAMSATPHQVVITSAVWPYDAQAGQFRAPEGWTVIDTTTGLHRKKN